MELKNEEKAEVSSLLSEIKLDVEKYRVQLEWQQGLISWLRKSKKRISIRASSVHRSLRHQMDEVVQQNSKYLADLQELNGTFVMSLC